MSVAFSSLTYYILIKQATSQALKVLKFLNTS